MPDTVAIPEASPEPVLNSGPLTLPDAATALEDPGAALFLQLKHSFGLYSGREVERATTTLVPKHQLIEGLLPTGSVNILVGDSGIGKSPMAYQMALCLAAGTPFLGMAVAPSKVLFCDYENHLADIHSILMRLSKHLGIARVPDTFLFWPLSRDPRQNEVEIVIRKLAPDFVVIDSLRAFNPQMETESAKAVEQIARLREISAAHGTAFLFVHHVHKHTGSASLEDGHALNWLRRAAGVRALINQTDVRLGISRRDTAKVREEGAADLVLSGHFRTRGELGPYLIRRAWNEGGEAAGYSLFEPEVRLIENPEHQRVFERLADDFTFRDAKLALAKGAEATNWFVHKLIRLGLIRKIAVGKYRKYAVDENVVAAS